MKHRLQNIIKTIYFIQKSKSSEITEALIPYLRRLTRLMALPYCFLYQIDWHECNKAKIFVFKDLLYIFFVLKYYPDNYGRCRLWEKKKTEWKYYYGSIYDPYQRKALGKLIQRKEYEIIFENKYICYELCKAASIPLPVSYGIIEPFKDYHKKIKLIFDGRFGKSIIIKPLDGSGGEGIAVINSCNEHIIVNMNNKEIPLREFRVKKTSLVQEYIEQLPEIANFSSSTNTIRIVTLLTKKEDVIIIGAIMRFGVKNSYIDNTSKGGISVGINTNNGRLMKRAYSLKGKIYEKHPDSKIPFKGFRVPFWKDSVSLAYSIQKYFFYYKLICCDFALSSEGPILIEINAKHDNVGLEQKCGPILLNHRILTEFGNYGLLINEKTKKLRECV